MPARDLGTLGEAGKWLILLSDCVAEQDLPSVVAHEIAHVGLEHEALLGGDAWIDAEEAAATLVGEWGFSGLGVRPSSEGVARRSTVR